MQNNKFIKVPCHSYISAYLYNKANTNIGDVIHLKSNQAIWVFLKLFYVKMFTEEETNTDKRINIKALLK